MTARMAAQEGSAWWAIKDFLFFLLPSLALCVILLVAAMVPPRREQTMATNWRRQMRTWHATWLVDGLPYGTPDCLTMPLCPRPDDCVAAIQPLMAEPGDVSQWTVVGEMGCWYVDLDDSESVRLDLIDGD